MYYRLVHGYKIGNKSRQQTLLNLGRLEGLSKESHKLLADRIESLLTGAVSPLFDVQPEIEVLAQEFAEKITAKGIFLMRETTRPISKDIETDFQEVDINSIEQLDSKTIGGEWLVKQAFDKLSSGSPASLLWACSRKNFC